MTDELRRAIAYLALRRSTGNSASAVYDYAASAYFQFSGEVTATRVNIYDYGRSCHLDGTPPSLYDYGTSSYFEFKESGRKFEGYDYATSSFWEATINGRSVSVYDYERSAYFDYSL